MKITLLSGSVVGTKTQTTMTIIQKKIQEQYPESSVTLLDLKQLTLQFSDGRNYLDYTDDTRFVTTTLMDSDIILIGSPTFQASIPGTLKNVFDLLPQSAFENKVVGLVMTAGSAKHFLVAEMHLKPIIHYMKGNLVANYVFIEERDFHQATIVNDDVLLRLDKLIEDAIVLTKAYKQVWAEQEASYDF